MTDQERSPPEESRPVRMLVLAASVVAVGVVITLLPLSLRAPHADHVLPRDSACGDRPYAWSASTVGAAGDSVLVSGYSFRPGRPSQVVSSGLVHNRTGSTLEFRGYRVEFLSGSGDVVGESTCRIIMGGEQCGVGGTNLKRPGEIALTTDTLLGAPESADRDTARISWSYCRALGSND